MGLSPFAGGSLLVQTPKMDGLSGFLAFLLVSCFLLKSLPVFRNLLSSWFPSTSAPFQFPTASREWNIVSAFAT